MKIEPNDLSVNSWSSVRRSGFSLIEDKGIRIIHLPTGTIVEVDSERSQHANRAKALRKLEDNLKAVAQTPSDLQWLVNTVEWLSEEGSDGGITTCKKHKGYGFDEDCSICTQLARIKNRLSTVVED